MGDEKSKFQTLEKELKKEFNNAWEKIENRDEVFDLADEYKSFLDNSKTERLCADEILRGIIRILIIWSTQRDL